MKVENLFFSCFWVTSLQLLKNRRLVSHKDMAKDVVLYCTPGRGPQTCQDKKRATDLINHIWRLSFRSLLSIVFSFFCFFFKFAMVENLCIQSIWVYENQIKYFVSSWHFGGMKRSARSCKVLKAHLYYSAGNISFATSLGPWQLQLSVLLKLHLEPFSWQSAAHLEHIVSVIGR